MNADFQLPAWLTKPAEKPFEPHTRVDELGRLLHVGEDVDAVHVDIGHTVGLLMHPEEDRIVGFFIWGHFALMDDHGSGTPLRTILETLDANPHGMRRLIDFVGDMTL